MKRFALLVLVALTGAPLQADLAAPPDRVYDVDFSGMGCAICRKQIKEIILKIKDVKAVDYDLKASKCYVTMNGSATLTYAQLDEAFRPTKYIFRGVTECKNPPKLPATDSKPAEGSKG
jgi:copper chaperone CopZ